MFLGYRVCELKFRSGCQSWQQVIERGIEFVNKLNHDGKHACVEVKTFHVLADNVTKHREKEQARPSR